MSFMTGLSSDEADRAGDGFLKGLAKGTVENNKDGLNLGRVEVKLDNHNDDQKTYWAQVLTPMGGPERGLYCLPDVDDKVLVGFIAEDPSQPVVLGALWDTEQVPPDNNSHETNDRRLWRTRSGHELRFDDSDKKEIELKTADGTRVFLNQSTAVMEDASGNKVEIKDGSITIKAQTKISLEAAQIEIKADSTAKLQAGATCQVKGGMVEIN